MLKLRPLPNGLFPAQLPCYEGQPGELKADPICFLLEIIVICPPAVARPVARRRWHACFSAFRNAVHDVDTSVRMTPGGPGCGLQIRRRCKVAEAQLLLSDVGCFRPEALSLTIG